MTEQNPSPNGTESSCLPAEQGESFINRRLDAFRKMTTLTKTAGIVGIMVITLLCYLGKGKVFKRRSGI
jgi:hypothetical protein